ncbi:unnamed protein product [Heterobilharzia americana]|nr:unnamed protein product [Heterobilharzia americana]
MLLEGFQLLSNPPQSILSVTRHKWLSDNFKRCALDSTVWTILLTKRKMLKYPNGFYAYYYSMIGTLLPGLAWGYLGPNEAYFNLCDHFREIILSFIRELFISYDDSNQCSFICSNGKQYDIDEDHHKVNSCLVNYSLNKEVANSTISSNNQDNNNNIDDTLSESGPTLVYKMDELDNQLINYRQKIGLRYTTINELSNDLYQLINIYSQQLLNIFLNESQLCNNPLTNELNTNPIQPELDLNCVL